MIPLLREELSLYASPATASGSPTWSIHDPVRNLYFRIDWLTFEILSRWGLPDPSAIVSSISDETPIEHIEVSDVEDVLRFLAESELLQRSDAAFTKSLVTGYERRKQSFGKWLIHNYLFFRIPLWRPDQWLSKSVSSFNFFYTKTFIWVTILALMFGLFELTRQWDTFAASFVDLFSWQGLVAYSATLVVAKFLHELSHALMAKRKGCRVASMGVAFLVMFPVAYTDVNEAWKLKDRNDRFMVGAAGILAELIIAVWATVLWAILPDGFLRTAMFLLASTTWITTLVINAMPFLRFDGYFLLMDWLNLHNLHARSFEFSKWQLRKWVFKRDDSPPEYLSKGMSHFLTIFGYLTWLYRLVVFGGIALLVYGIFPKPLGPFLAGIEIFWFILFPMINELKTWPKFFKQVKYQSAMRNRLVLLLSLLAIIFLPWDSRVSGHAVLMPLNSFSVIAQGGAKIKDMPISNGSHVASGDVLYELSQPDVIYQAEALKARLNGLEMQHRSSGFSNELLTQQTVILAERDGVKAELKGKLLQQDQMVIRAPFDGVFFISNPDLQVGSWVSKNEKLGEMVSPDGFRVETYLSERDVKRIKVGDKAIFHSESGVLSGIDLVVENIDLDSVHSLNQGMLASTRGGPVAVREHSSSFVPERALFRVAMKLENPIKNDLLIKTRGTVTIFGKPHSLGFEYLLAGVAIIFREAGF